MKYNWNSIKNIFSDFRGLIGIGVTDVASSGIAALFWFYIASALGPEPYGKVSYLIAVATLTSTVSLLGSTNMLTVYTAKNVKIESAVYLISIICGLIASIILYFITYDVSASAYVIGIMIIGLGNATIIGKKSYKNYSKYIIAQKLLMASLSISMYYTIGFDGILFGIALSSAPYLIIIYKGFRESKIDFRLIKDRFAFMSNSYMLNLSSAFTGSIDKLIIVPLLGLGILGNYQLGIQFLAVLQILPSIVYKYILPQDASGNPNRNLKKVIIVISAIFTVCGIVLSPFIIPKLFPKYESAVQVIQIISLSLVPDTIITIYQSKYFGNEKSRIVLIGSIIHISVQITTILLLGKIFGANGIAASLVLSSLASCMFYLTTSRFFEAKGKSVLS
jgi:O-antigen/teichoic acid export membrane protein